MWNTVTPVALPTTQTLENCNLKDGNINRKWKLCLSWHRLKLVSLFLVNTLQNNMSIRLVDPKVARQNSNPQFCRWHCDAFPLPAMPSQAPAYRLCKPPSNLSKKFRLTSNSWQTDPCLTLTGKHIDIQAVQNVLKFLHYLNYEEKLMMGHTIWATWTCKRGQAEDSRASSKGTDCCSAPCTQHTRMSDTKESQFCSHRSHWCGRTQFSAVPLSCSKKPLS